MARSAFNPPRRVRLRDAEGRSRMAGDGGARDAADGSAHGPDHGSGSDGSGAPRAGERLQKVLAQAGYGSRRACEVLIGQGRVSLDGEVVTAQGVRVDPTRAVIHVDGRRVQLDQSLVTYALNKPRHVVTAMEDPQGRRNISEFTADLDSRVYHVGRLDYDTEGLLLLTNDGELAHRLTHPSFEVAKTYVATVEAPQGISRGSLARLRKGVDLEDGEAHVDSATLVAQNRGSAIVEVTLHSGRNRIVRRLFDAIGHPVDRLVRTRIGPVLLADLHPGDKRPLTDRELGTLMAEVGL